MTLSAEAEALLERARSCEDSADVYLGAGEARTTVVRLTELLGNVNAASLGERALWNLLFAAGELSLTTDVFRAHDLFLASASLVRRVAALPLAVGDPRASAAEMAFDFFFARPGPPLLSVRGSEVVAVLGELLMGGQRIATRAAIHGLGHLVANGTESAAAQACALLDRYSPPDEALQALTNEARRGASA